MNMTAHTLMKAIQAVSAKTQALAKQIENADDPDLSDYEEEMLGFSKAQMELKKLYMERQQLADNLPPYEELIAID
jgi:hypothetical protein